MNRKRNRWTAVWTISLIAAVLAGMLPVQAWERTAHAEAAAAEIYVAPDGDDAAGDGSLTKPYKSLFKAQEAARSMIPTMTGDVVVNLRGGDYSLNRTLVFNNQDSGRNGHQVIYRSYGNEQAKLHVGTPVTGWQSVPGKPYYKANVGVQTFGRLYENGEAALIARYPNMEQPDAYNTERNNFFRAKRNSYLRVAESVLAGTDASKQEFKFSPDNRIPYLTNQADLEVMIWPGSNDGTVNWFEELHGASIDYTSYTVKLSDSAGNNLGKGSRYYLQNALDFLDQPGEFYLDRSKGDLYYYPRSGSPDQAVITAPHNGEGIVFDGGSTQVHDIVLQGLDISGSDRHRALVSFYRAKDITLTRSIIHGSGGEGIRFDNGSDHVTVDSNVIRDIGVNGIAVWAARGTVAQSVNHQITNNHIFNIGVLFGHGSGIYIENSKNTYMAHNLIHDISNQAVAQKGAVRFPNNIGNDSFKDVVQTRNNIFEFNEIYSTNNDTQDSGPIYSWGAGTPEPGYENIIRNNWVHDTDIYFSFGMGGVYMDNDSDRFVIENNLFTDNQKHGKGTMQEAIFSRGKDNRIVNNIVANNNFRNGTLVSMYPIFGDPDSGNVIERNIQYESGISPYFVMHWNDQRFRKTDYNVFYNTQGVYKMTGQIPAKNLEEWRFLEGGKYDQYSLAADPLFMNPAEKDYRLRYDSPAYGLGIQDLNLQDIGLTSSFPFAAADEAMDRLYIRKSGDTVNRSWIELSSGQTAQLELAARTESGYVYDLTGASVTYGNNGADAVATVDASGKVTAQGKGVARITVTVTKGGVTKSMDIHALVDDSVRSIELKSAQSGFTPNQSAQLHVVGTTELGRQKDLTGQVVYTSSNPDALAVDAQGKLNAVAVGASTITARYGDGGSGPGDGGMPIVLTGPPVFRNLAGDTVDRLNPGETLIGQATLKNRGAAPRQVTMIAALYHPNHTLANLSFVQRTLAAGATEVFGAGFTLPQDTHGLYAKVMVWDNLHNMTPLSAAYRFPDDGTNPPAEPEPAGQLTRSIPMGVYASILNTVQSTVSSSQVMVGNTARISVTGTMTDGASADLSQAQIRYAADDPAKAAVAADGTLTGLAPGLVRINVFVTLNGVTRLTTVNVTVFPDGGGSAPEGWNVKGYGTASGFGVNDGDGYFVMGSGRDVWGKPDDFVFMYKNITADPNTKVTVKATLNWMQASDANAQLGVMIRDQDTDSAKHVHFRFRPDGGPRFAYRSDEEPNGTGFWEYANVSFPVKMKLEKIGDEFIASVWKTVGGNDQYQDYVEIQRVRVAMGTDLMAGLGWFSIDGNPIQASLTDVTIETQPLDYQLASMDLSKNQTSLSPGEKTGLKAFAYDALSKQTVDLARLQGVTLAYSSSDPSVAAVSAAGEVTGKQPGAAQIQVVAKLGDKVLGSQSLTIIVYGKKLFTDSFDAASYDNWDVRSSNGLPSGGDIANTHTGYKSFKADQDLSYMTLKPDAVTGAPSIAEVWLYDDGAGRFMNASPSEALMTGVDATVSETHYVTSAGSGTVHATPVGRTKGWHQLVFDGAAVPGETSVWIDGILVGTQTGDAGTIGGFLLGDTRADGLVSNLNADDAALFTLDSPVLTTLSVAKNKPGLLVGGDLQLTVVARDQEGDAINPLSVNVGYSSSDPAVAQVSASGKVTAVGVGTATITVTAEFGGITLQQSTDVDVKLQYTSLQNMSSGKHIIEVDSKFESWMNPDNMTDGSFDAGSAWESAEGRTHWAVLDLGEVKEISRFIVGHRSYYNTQDYQIFTSLDNEHWVEQVTVTNNTEEKRTHDIYPVQTRYVKLFITRSANGTMARITELQAWGYADPSLPKRIQNEVVVTADREDGGMHPANANDGNMGSQWQAWGDTDHWLLYDLKASHILKKFVLTPESAYYHHSNYTIESSANGTDWTTLVTVVNGPEQAQDVHELAAPAAARYVRLTIKGQIARVREFEVWGNLDPNWPASIDPRVGSVNKSDPQDIAVSMKLYGHVFLGLTWGGTAVPADQYAYDPEKNLVTLFKTYLSTLPAGEQTIFFQFDGGGDQELKLTVTDSPLVLISQGKPVTATSSQATAGNVADGNDGSKWDAGGGTPQSLIIDLQSPMSVSKFVVKHNGAAEPNSGFYNTSDFSLWTSMDGTDWTQQASISGNTANATSHNVAPVTARYAKLLITKANNTGWDNTARIAEFQVYGSVDASQLVSLDMSGMTTQLTAGASIQAAPVGITSSGQRVTDLGASPGRSLAYSSSDTGVTTVSPSGLIQAVAPGVTSVKASVTENGRTVSGSVMVIVYGAKLYSEGFENPSDVANPAIWDVWGVSTNNKTVVPAVVTDTVRTGTNSLQLNLDHVVLTPKFDIGASTVMEAWFYDVGQDGTKQLAAGPGYNELVGIRTGIDKVYYVRDNGDIPTTLPRSRGWHQIVFENRGGQLSAYIDGILVRTIGWGLTNLGHFEIGDHDNNGQISNLYVDDITFFSL